MLTNSLEASSLESESFSILIRKSLELIEKNKKFKVTVLGEPQMSKRDLYPTLSTKKNNDNKKLMMDLISMCDGNNSLLKIANTLNVPAWDLYEIIDKLKSYNLIVESN